MAKKEDRVGEVGRVKTWEYVVEDRIVFSFFLSFFFLILLILKPVKSVLILPVTTRTSKYRKELNLYGLFIQKASDLRRRWVMYPGNPS